MTKKLIRIVRERILDFVFVLLLVLLFFSDFALAVLGVVIFGGFVLLGGLGPARHASQLAGVAGGERLWFFLKTVGIALGLSAFYLVPLLFSVHLGGAPFDFAQGKPRVTPEVEKMFDVLFKQAYPGPHFVVLSLAGLLLLAVFLVRHSGERSDSRISKNRDERSWTSQDDDLSVDARMRNMFYLFAVLTVFFLLNALGYMPIKSGIASIHIVYLITLFAVITIALGCSYLGKEAVSSRILFVAVAALSAISLQNTKTLASHRFQYQSSLTAPVDSGMFDSSKQYRVYHPNENERAILFKIYDLFFTGESANPLFFDWFGVREAYLYKDRNDGSGQELDKRFDNEDFEKRGDYTIYKRATPIVYATNSQPVLLYAKDDDVYHKQLEDLAFQGVALERVIPIRTKRWDKNAKIPIVSSVKELKEKCKRCFDPTQLDMDTPFGLAQGGQQMSYVSPGRWEISLGKPFDLGHSAELPSVNSGPEHVEGSRRPQGGQYRGVVFKQTFDKNWKAELVEGKQKQRLPIRKAGPNMMYVFLPQYLRPAKVIFTYQQSWGEKVGIVVTIGTVLMVPMYRFKKKLLYGYIAKWVYKKNC